MLKTQMIIGGNSGDPDIDIPKPDFSLYHTTNCKFLIGKSHMT